MNSRYIIRMKCRHVDDVRNVYSDHKLYPLHKYIIYYTITIQC